MTSRETLVSLFERCVEKNPSKPAVQGPAGFRDYQSLNRQANQIAHALLSLGGDVEEPVVLFFDDATDSIAATFGALKAGKVYVPLDPGMPRSRCASIAEDAGARVVLTVRKHAGLAADLAGAKVQLLLTDELDSGLPDRNPDLDISPARQASMYYTSGSTGVPKGVPQRHEARVACHNAYTRALDLTADDRFALLYSCTFSGAVNNLYGALLNGGTVFPFDVRQHGFSSLAQWLEQERITIFHSVPSMFRGLMEVSEGHSFPDMRVVMLSSDTVHGTDVEAFRERFPRTCRFCNMWGVSESGFCAPYWVDWEQDVGAGPVPSIGLVDGPDEILLVDGEGKEVAVGEAGEIVIRGNSLSPGYWRRPEQTRERFFPDPDNPALRRYHTGDLGRRLADGSVIHLGRNDFQVKVRGYRIELEEIEAVLREFVGVNDAVVVAAGLEGDEKRLVAHVVAEEDVRLSEQHLREVTAEKLPNYMMPAKFVFHEMLPLTPGGKADRRALAVLDVPGSAPGEQREPRTSTERILSEIWHTVLPTERIGIDGDFFELGGDSLKAMRIAAEIEKKFNQRVSPALLLAQPTIERLARAITAADTGSSSLVAIQPSGSRPPLFCVHGSGGTVFFYRGLAEELGEDQPLYALQSVGLDGKEPPLTTVAAMAEHYVEEICRVQPNGPYRLAGFCTGAYIALAIASALVARGEEVAFLASLNADGEWQTVNGGASLHRKRLSCLRWRGKLQYISERVGYRWGWARNRVGARMVALSASRLSRYRVETTNDRAVADYQPEPFQGRVVLFLAEENSYADPAPFWGPIARGGLEVRQVPGGNESMFDPPHVTSLARELRACLDTIPATRCQPV